MKYKLEHFLDQLLNKYDVETVIIFGSTAKGNSNYRSDIDLLIVSNSMGKDWFERHKNAFKLSIGLVQPFVLTIEEFNSAIDNRQMIVWEALADGIVIKDTGIGKTQQNNFNDLIQQKKIQRTKQGWSVVNL